LSGRRVIALLAGTLVAFLLPSAASAAVPVTTPVDEQDGECALDCSLRDALVFAGRAGDVVQLPSGTYTLTLGQLPVANATIQGAGAGATIIQGGNNQRVIQINGNATISGVTITGGVNGFSGAGIQVGNNQVAMTLQLSDSAVSGNAATTGSNGFGGGIMVGGLATLVMTNSTVSGNRVQGGDGTGAGAGVYVDANGRAELRNSTVSGNVAELGSSPGLGGGIAAEDASTLVMENVTVAANTAGSGGGVAQDDDGFSGTPPPTIAISDSIVAANSGGDCSGNVTHSGDRNLSSDASCSFNAAGDKQNTNPQLGPLQVNTGAGRTATHALALSSPAINAGDPTTCKATDQRGAPRPAGGCDIGAFEYVAPVLAVTTSVVNDDGGEDGPAAFTVHVRDAAGNEVGGSPQPGNPTGTSYALTPGSYRVAAEGPGLYTVAIGGACATDGSVSVGENQTATCTVTADDKQPRAGREVGALPAGGTVRIRKPGGRWQVLTGAGIMPNGTAIDTRRGRITMIAAANRSGRETKADFYQGLFVVRQSSGGKPTTTLTLTEKLTCPKAGSAIAAAKKRKRRLWGDGSGRFRTKGRHSAATVVGTKWLVEDRCKSTLTRVVRGRVSVRDFAKKKTVIVRKGKRYVAKARS
jgi:hypothetical protein